MKITINQALQQAVAAHQKNKFTEAEKIYRAILQIHPMHTAVNSNLGVMFYKLGRLDEAQSCYKKLITQNPNHAESHCNLGVILQELNKLKDSEISFKKAIELKPNYELAHNNLGNTLKKLGRSEEAATSYKVAIALKPDYVEAFYNLSVLLQEIDSLESSEEICKKAIMLKPDYAEIYNNLGITLQKLGKIEEAEVNYKKAIHFKSKYVDAHFNLSQIKNFIKEDKQFVQLQDLYLDQNLDNEQRCQICFALGKAFEDLNQFDKSFKYYCEGNAHREKSIIYDTSQDIKLFNQLKKSYPNIKKSTLKTANLPNEPKLIFIVGMPRSGTTLLEQIISSHSNVSGAGELFYVEKFGDDTARGVSKINSNTLLDIRKKYFQKLKELSIEKHIITDKMTMNFRYIGLICATFIDAKIVHIKRNSAATCWGNYRQLFFNKESFQYSYNLDDTVRYYALYQNLMKFWDEQCGNRIYNVNYEELTVNPETETKKLIQYLDLKWEEGCLSPQDNKRSVSTASSKQIRQKIYQGSSQKWKKFEPFLNDKFNHLANDL